MLQLASALFSPRFLVLYAYVACVAYVHFRGKVRLRFGRQLSEHSGLFSPFNVLMYAFSAVPRRPILDVDDFPELHPLRANWETIRDEANALCDAGAIDYTEEHDDLAFVAFRKRGWKRFYLKWYHDFLPSAAALCPRTVELVRSIPSINAAAFTMLPPGKKLGKHRDPFACSLRFHLGLTTPGTDECRIWIDGEPYTWRDGEAIVFDETYVHWAENKSDQNRIILFCDFTRPLRTRFMRAFSRFMIRHVFGVTRSHNRPDEERGSLNRLTPLVHRLKTFFLALKKRNRRLYYAGKYALAGSVGYLFFLDPFLA